MAEPTPFAMSNLLSDLIGKKVSFSQLTQPGKPKGKQMYGVYLVHPGESTRVLQADLLLLGSFAGSLLGFPAESVNERVAAATLEEPLRDAIHEVLNVASTVVSVDHRAVFQKMYDNPVYLPEAAAETLRAPVYRSYFNVTVTGYEGGYLSLLAPL